MKVQFKTGLLTFSSSSAIIMEDLIKSLSVLKLHIIHLQYINYHVESLLPLSSNAFTINSSCFFFSWSSHIRSSETRIFLRRSLFFLIIRSLRFTTQRLRKRRSKLQVHVCQSFSSLREGRAKVLFLFTKYTKFETMSLAWRRRSFMRTQTLGRS